MSFLRICKKKPATLQLGGVVVLSEKMSIDKYRPEQPKGGVVLDKQSWESYQEERFKNHVFWQCKNCNKCFHFKNKPDAWTLKCDCGQWLIKFYNPTPTVRIISYKDYLFFIRLDRTKALNVPIRGRLS